ncbi:MAG: winged helix-turn-helix domain-containing protein [Gammaproteobacteria bacterium]|nr:winged helix-turn-helix domain-containing protein [Gammaproteobacteria bacterium]
MNHIPHWQLADWRIDPASNLLQNKTQQLALEPRVMTALVLLLQADGQTVTDTAMLQGVWPGLVVSDASLYKVVAQLRKALADQQKPYQLIERVHSKGYRLLQPAIRIPAVVTSSLQPTNEAMQVDASIVAAVAAIANPNASETQPEQSAMLTPRGFQQLAEPTTKIIEQRRFTTPLFWGICLLVLIGFAGWFSLSKNSPMEAGLTEQVVPLLATKVNSATMHDEVVSSIDIALNITPGTALSSAILPEAGFSQQQWEQFLQAKWLAQQPKAAAVKQAIDLLQQMLPTLQQSAPLLTELCNSYHYMHIYGDWPLQKVQALCEPLLRQALQLQPNSAAALASFGALMLSQQNLPAAAHYLDQALALDANDRNTLLWRAALYRGQDQFSAASKLLQQAIQLDPLSGLLKRHYAYSLIGNGMLSEARDQFRQSLLLDPDYSDRALDELEMLPLTSARAAAFLNWAKRFPDRMQHPGRLVNLALVQLSLMQLDVAEETLQQAAKLYPQQQFVLLAKAMLAQAKGHPEQARLLLTERARRRPDHPMFQLQALLLADDIDFGQLQPKFLQLYPHFAENPLAASQQALAQKQQVLVLYWLLTVPPVDRVPYQRMISDFVVAQTDVDSLSLQLYCVVGLTEQANQLAQQLLQQDWLPSPQDNYYLAEQHPLWRQLDPEIFRQIQQQRQKVLQLTDHPL